MDQYQAIQISPGQWMVKWFKPELAGNEGSGKYVEASLSGDFKTDDEAIDAAILRGSWA